MAKNKKAKIHIRPTWDEYFSQMVELVGARATCDRGRSGCVIVKDKRVLCTGYVGSPMGTAHCDEDGHEMHTVLQDDGTQSRHCIRTSHAEQNALSNAARFGVATDGATLYCHMTPCYTCAKMLINAGIKKIVSNLDYHGGARSKEILKEAGVEFVLLNDDLQTYKDMK